MTLSPRVYIRGMRPAVVALFALLAVGPAAYAQSSWTGVSSNLWTDPGNWSAGVPGAGTTALFNAATANMSISLGGAPQTVAGIQFDNTGGALTSSYTLGQGGGGAFVIATAGTSTTGAISMTSTVNNAQTIADPISFSAAAPINITNSGATGSSLTFNGNITLPTGTTNIYAAVNTTGQAVSSPVTIVNGVISGPGLLSLQGGGSSTGGTGAASTLTAGTYEPTAQNTYTGGTNLAGQYTIIPITESSIGTPTAVTSGPFGTGTIAPGNGANARFRPSGASFTILNAITTAGAGLAMESNQSNDPNSLTFAGPITAGARFISNGFTTSEGLATPLYGASMILGLAATPSTLTLPATGTVSIVALTGPVVINDTITGSVATVAYNVQAGDMYSVQVNGANTYTGPTTIGGAAFAAMGAVLIGSSSNATAGTGPFGNGGTVTINNTNTAPVLAPVGADQTVSNAIAMSSSFAVANGWYNTTNIRGTTHSTLNTDPTGSHSLTFSGPITLGATSRTLYNVMSAGTNLNLGLAGSASTLSIGSTLVIQSLPGYPTGTTVINDAVSGAGGLTVQYGAVVQLTNANTYTGTTTVTSSAAGAPGGTLLVNNTSGSGTGIGPVNVNATAGPGGSAAVGTGGTLGGTGTITGLTSISSATPANQGGIVSPGPGGAAAGTLNVGSMNWQPFGRYVFNYNGSNNATGGGVNNLISGSGTLDLSNLTAGTPFDLNLQPIAAGPTTQPYVIANFSGGITGAGNATGVPFTTGTDISNLFTSSGMQLSAPLTATIIAGAGSGASQAIQLSFTPVPEPGFILAACGGLTALVGWRRSRRRIG